MSRDTKTSTVSSNLHLHRLWAKSSPRYPLWKHLLDAAAVSCALPNPIASYGWNDNQVALLVGLHDIGKADACFQHQVSEFSDELASYGFPRTDDARCRHERLSARFILKKLEAFGINATGASAICRAILAHHGYWYETARDVDPEYAAAQESFYSMLTQLLKVEALPDISSDLSAFGIRLVGHIVLCDWIASNEKFFTDRRLHPHGIENFSDYFAKAKEVAGEWVAKLAFDRNRDSGQPMAIVETARPIQKVLLNEDIPPGLVIIEAPMGEGKTEAAWILAEKWRKNGYHGMYMALPTMATSDSLHSRYRDDYLKKLGRGEDAKLVHGMAWLRDDGEPEKMLEVGEPGDDRDHAVAWFRSTRRAMLAAHGVGTVDQVMLAGMNVKFGFLRLFGLADRVLVVDEIHAYDAYMSAIIARLLQWCACLKIPVIILSATLSARQRAAMIEAYGATGGDPGPDAPYPLITVVESGQEARTIKVNSSSSRTLMINMHPGLLGDARKTAAKAAELVKDGGCCCVILNTVKQAQAVFRELVPEESGNAKASKQRKSGRGATPLTKDEVLLFHARFTAADRKRIADDVCDKFGKGRWVEENGERTFRAPQRPQKFILVATQVVEQSLDVDFDYMISEIAPIDLLLQRSGRIKRHARDKQGKLTDGADQRGDPVLQVLLSGEKKGKNGQVKPVDFGPSETIYQRYPLLRTLGVLKSKISLPDQFRSLIEQVYKDTLPENSSDDLEESKIIWSSLQEILTAQAGQFLLCEPMADEFDPVGADEVGDDSDDGNGWRARTRLGMEDVLVIPVANDDVKQLAKGELSREKVRELYQQSVKIPSYSSYWPPKEAKGYGKPLLGEKRLRGVWLLPVKSCNGGWRWEGVKDDGKFYTIEYDSTLGLCHGGDK